MASDGYDSSSSRPSGPYGSDPGDIANLALSQSTALMPPSNLSDQQLREMLKASQIHQQMLENQLKELRIDYEELEAANKSTKTSRAAKKTLKGESLEISRAGGMFSVFGELWLSKTTLGIPLPEGVDPLNPSRYNDPAGGSEARAVIAELYSHLKPHLQLALADDDRCESFKEIYLAQFNQERADTVHAARLFASQLFDGVNLSPRLFARKSVNDRMTSTELKNLLGNPRQPGVAYPSFPRLIYPNYDVTSNRPYRSMALIKFLRIKLWGPSSIEDETVAKRATKGVLWDLDGATPGMIAMAATVLTYACSPDQTFSEKSLGPSRISWGQCFKCHKRAILSFPTAHRNDLLSWYNKKLFGKDPDISEPSSSNGPGPGSYDEEFEDLVSGLDQASVKSPSGSPAIQPNPQLPAVPHSPPPAPSSFQMEQPEPEEFAEADKPSDEPQNVARPKNNKSTTRKSTRKPAKK
ncbi:hypothetical protein EDB92DRAFT_1987350 [Lactarius akahatsu]|uniref:Uncharacterized protein n=1 Tax=Lactarius akahatsu TaxID=416441 RepID=A0AAD4L6F6_9AGAM|nr:hypothetical protein EDB92DRAFT_1987350 [Lactarius akahatsu]